MGEGGTGKVVQGRWYREGGTGKVVQGRRNMRRCEEFAIIEGDGS